MSVSCQSCGAAVSDAARFCGHCGREVVGVPTNERTRVATPSLLAQHQRPATIVRTAPAGPPAFGAPALDAGAPMVGQRESLLLVIDTSGSMGEVFEGGITKLEAAIRAGANLILHKVRIDPLDEIGVVSFTDRAIVEFAPASCGSDKSDMIRSLQQLTPGGGTDLDAGLRAAETALPWGRSDLTRRIVMLTDGNGGHPLRTATSLKSRGVVLDVIGVGESPNDVDEKLLRALASVVAGELRYRFIKNQAALVTRYTALANKTQLATP